MQQMQSIYRLSYGAKKTVAGYIKSYPFSNPYSQSLLERQWICSGSLNSYGYLSVLILPKLPVERMVFVQKEVYFLKWLRSDKSAWIVFPLKSSYYKKQPTEV
jgi:hypothetical protein